MVSLVSQSKNSPSRICSTSNTASSYWRSRLETSGLRGFDEELSIYDLLDLDAEGDDEIDDGRARLTQAPRMSGCSGDDIINLVYIG